MVKWEKKKEDAKTQAIAMVPQVINEKTLKDFLIGSWTTLSDTQFTLFLGIAQANGLNPFKREIYAIPYKKRNPAKWIEEVTLSIVTWYQTYIERADRSGALDGWSVETFKDEEWKLSHATITIHRKNFAHPFQWTVEMEEVAKYSTDKKTGTRILQWLWKTMPKFMLKKVAIAQWFRLAFPNELGGMPYIEQELTTGEVINMEPIVQITDEQKKKIGAARWELREKAMTHKPNEVDKEWNLRYTKENIDSARKKMIKSLYWKDSMKDMTKDEASAFIKKIEEITIWMGEKIVEEKEESLKEKMAEAGKKVADKKATEPEQPKETTIDDVAKEVQTPPVDDWLPDFLQTPEEKKPALKPNQKIVATKKKEPTGDDRKWEAKFGE